MPADDWWEDRGVEIGLAAFYAICIAQCFDTATTYFRQHPIAIDGFPTDFSKFPICLDKGQIAVLAQLAAFSAWISMSFLSNTKLYFKKDDPQSRPLNFVYIAVTLGLFYFLAGTIGSGQRQQVFLIGTILVSDLVFPLRRHIPDLRGRKIFLSRTILSLLFAWSTLLFWPDSWVESWWLPVVFFFLIVAALLFALAERFRRARSDPAPVAPT